MPDRLSAAAERLLRKLVGFPPGTALVLDRFDEQVALDLAIDGFAQTVTLKPLPRYMATAAGRECIDAIDEERQAAAEEGLHA